VNKSRKMNGLGREEKLIQTLVQKTGRKRLLGRLRCR